MTITTFSFTTYGTITTWTVPFYTAGTMSAKVAGGEGGGSTGYSTGGLSGRIYGEFDLADAYSVGDRVTFQGAVWESTMDANVWSPTAYPAGWKKV